jgi:hypothetical protein
MLIIPQVVLFPDFSPSGMSVHFIPYGKKMISRVQKKFGRFVTLSTAQKQNVERLQKKGAEHPRSRQDCKGVLSGVQ